MAKNGENTNLIVEDDYLEIEEEEQEEKIIELGAGNGSELPEKDNYLEKNNVYSSLVAGKNNNDGKDYKVLEEIAQGSDSALEGIVKKDDNNYAEKNLANGNGISNYSNEYRSSSDSHFDHLIKYYQKKDIFFSEDKNVKIDQYVNYLGKAALFLASIPDKTKDELKELCEVNEKYFFFDDLTPEKKTKRDEFNSVLKNITTFLVALEDFEKNRVIKEGYNKDKSKEARSTEDLLMVPSDFSIHREVVKTSNCFFSQGYSVKDFFAVVKNNIPTHNSPVNEGQANGYAPDQKDYSGEYMEHFSIFRSDSEDLEDKTLKIGNKYMEIKTQIIKEYRRRTNAREYVYHNSLKAVEKLEKQILDEQRENFTLGDNIRMAKDYIKSLENSDSEEDKKRLEVLHPFAKHMIEEFDFSFSKEELEKIDTNKNLKIKDEKDEGYWYSASYNPVSQDDKEKYVEISKKVCNDLHLIFENPLVSCVDAAIKKYSPYINSAEKNEIINFYENSPDFIELVNELPEDHPAKAKWENTKDGKDLFSVYGTYSVFDVASLLYNFNVKIISPISEERAQSVNTQVFCELMASKIPEAVYLVSDEDEIGNGFSLRNGKDNNYQESANDRTKQIEESTVYLQKLQDLNERIYFGSNLNPFYEVLTRVSLAKSSGRGFAPSGGYINLALDSNNLEEEVDALKKYYPMFNNAGKDISYDGQKISELLKK